MRQNALGRIKKVDKKSSWRVLGKKRNQAARSDVFRYHQMGKQRDAFTGKGCAIDGHGIVCLKASLDLDCNLGVFCLIRFSRSAEPPSRVERPARMHDAI